jgi:hypothetical protein
VITPINPASNLPTDGLIIDRTGSAGQSLLQRLQQLGEFRARVVLTEGRRILLDTAFGQLRGQLPAATQGKAAQLQSGDLIEARLTRSGNQPRLSIRHHQPLQQHFRQADLYRQLQQTPNRILAAQVRTQPDGGELRIQIGSRQYPVPADKHLQAGDTVLLRPGDKAGLIEMQRVQPLPLLRQALTRLLPRQSAPAQGTGSALPRLQQLIQQLPGMTEPLRTDPSPQARAAPTAAGQPAPPPSASAGMEKPDGGLPRSDGAMSGSPRPRNAEAHLPQPAPPGMTSRPDARPDAAPPARPAETPAAPADTPRNPVTIPQPGSEAGTRVQMLLQPLLRLVIDPSRLSPQRLQHTLAELGLTTGSPAQQPGPDLLPRLVELQALMRDQPQLFERLLRESFSHNPAARETPVAADDWPQWRQQFSQQLDQSINQLLLGKTGLRLQQEQQQPLNMNLVLPLQLPNEPQRELKLRLRERANPDNPEQPAWEVRLSFEFGMLGLITVHVLLQENRISAHFWAVEESTWRLIDAQLPGFRRQLLQSGFEPGLFDCFRGQPVTADDDRPSLDGDNLLDIEV